jgi:hypothetical protein
MPELPQSRPDEPRPAEGTRFEDQDRTLRALHRLERAAGAPFRRDATAWHHDLVEALDDLAKAMAEEQANANRPESLVSNIAQTQPRLRSRARGTRVRYQQLRESLGALRRDVDGVELLDIDLDDLRRRISRLASALRYQRARESDLIYEAYYDTFHADIESGTGGMAG